MDGLMLADEVARYFGDVRVVVNDLLMYLGPLRGLFVPVNKHGRQDAGSVEAFNNAFASDSADSDLPRRALFAPPPGSCVISNGSPIS